MTTPADQWTASQVAQWIAEAPIGLSSEQRAAVLAAFAAHEIDGFALLSLNVDTLRDELQLAAFGLRVKLAAAIAKLRLASPASPLNAPSNVNEIPTIPIISVMPVRSSLDRSVSTTGDSSAKKLRYRDVFDCSSNFIWSNADIQPQLTNDMHLFNLHSNSTDDSQDEDFYFKRRSHTMIVPSWRQRQVIIQRKIMRMLKNSNLIVFDKNSVLEDPEIRDIYHNICGSQCDEPNPGGVIAFWRAPVRGDLDTKLARVFRKIGSQNIIDFVDNSGRYSVNRTTQSQPIGQFLHSADPDDDTVLPAYGDSDQEMYESDSEWERDIRETQRTNSDKPKAPGSHKMTPDSNLIRTDTKDDTLSPTSELAFFPSQSNFRDNLVLESTDSARSDQTYENSKSSSLIHAAVQAQIVAQESEWTISILPKILSKAPWIYKTREKYIHVYKTQLDDLTSRRIPKMIQGILESLNGSLSNISRTCENIRPTIYDKMELKWKIQIAESENTPEESIPKPKKRPSSMSKVRNYNNDGCSENSDNDSIDDEDEHWSDFIASEDEDIILQEKDMVDRSGLRDYAATDNLRKTKRTRIDTSGKERFALPGTEEDKIPSKFHAKYLELLDILATSSLESPLPCSLQDFRLYQEYSAFLAHIQKHNLEVTKELHYDCLFDFEAFNSFDGSLEFHQWDTPVENEVQVPNATDIKDSTSRQNTFDESSILQRNEYQSSMWEPDEVKMVETKSNLLQKQKNSGNNSRGYSQKKSVFQPSSESEDSEDATDMDSSSLPDSSGTRGRTELRPIIQDSQSVRQIRANRKRQEDAISRRAKKQYKAARKRGDLTKIVINLGHDDNEDAIYVDDFLAMHLKPHQVEGIQFLWRSIIMIKDLDKNGASQHQGCILAHAMGLGKTLQTMTFLYTLQREIRANNPCIPLHLRTGGILVVCPAIVVENWANEIQKWVPSKQIDEVFGGIFTLTLIPENERIAQLESWNERRGIFITSYDMLRIILTPKSVKKVTEIDDSGSAATPDMAESSSREAEIVNAELAQIHGYLLSPGPALVVCDESHHIKNPQAGISQFLNEVHTPSRICLTGYPLQNNLAEYHAMINFISPGYLGTVQQFRNQYQNPITNDGDKVFSKQRLFVLINIIDPLLCRMSDDVLKDDLPEKNEYIISVKLTPLQLRLYKKYLEQSDKQKNIISRFSSLSTISNHPLAFKTSVETKTFPSDSDIEQAIENRSMRRLISDEGSIDWQSPSLSLKVMLTQHIVEQCTAIGDKVLIFSRSIPTIEMLKFKLKDFCKIQTLTGASKNRQAIIDEFNSPQNGFNVFIISTIAGGVGVNIVSANRIIIFDHGWNPSYDKQAIARAYRYGQEKNVYIYRLLTYGTFEEKIFMNNVHKITLATQVVDHKHIEKTTFKKELGQYLRPPPENPVSQLNSTNFNDPIVHSLAQLFRNDIIKIESHEDFVREIDDDLTDVQKEVAKEALVQEQYRRRNKLPFVETGRIMNATANAIVDVAGNDNIINSVEELVDGVSCNESESGFLDESQLPNLASQLDEVAVTFIQMQEEPDEEDEDMMLNLMAEGFEDEVF
ncbi:hypothetical protein HDU99_000171 [Rhizoclosmatium hyalinum]|nr:hypothetical protein HDU99_000171 [Rhizoclosmatium hyalinum]